MVRMTSEFTFFKAGQGAFYGGRIWLPSSNLEVTVVYDCGTSNFISGNTEILNREIDYFKFNPSRDAKKISKIDLLFISHLDYDHVSGLKRLLTEFKVEKIILPYIDDNDRILFMTSIPDENDPIDNLTSDDYISFIKDPSSFINEQSAETSQFYIKPGDDDISYQSYDNDSPDDIYPVGTEDSSIGLKTKDNIFIYKNGLQFFIKKNWEFATYVKGVNKSAIKKLRSNLRKLVKKRSNEDLTAEDLQTIVTSKRKRAHKCYVSSFEDINSHGLVLLHGPIGIEFAEISIMSQDEIYYFTKNLYYDRILQRRNWPNKQRPLLGTLLLGDTSLNQKKNPLNFPITFIEKLANVHVFQVPHHGSSDNWDEVKFSELRIGGAFPHWQKSFVAVCNFGYGNKFGHPSPQIINDLSSSLFLNSQYSRLSVRYIMLSENNY